MMKNTLASIIIALVILTSSFFARASPAHELQTRSLIDCDSRWNGYLVWTDGVYTYSVNMVKDKQGSTTLTTGEQQLNDDSDHFVFYECFASNWNERSQMYGVLFPVASSNGNECITASTIADSTGARKLNVEQCASSTGDQLARQWFHSETNSHGSVMMKLTGHVESAKNSYYLPYVRINNVDQSVSALSTSNGAGTFYLIGKDGKQKLHDSNSQNNVGTLSTSDSTGAKKPTDSTSFLTPPNKVTGQKKKL